MLTFYLALIDDPADRLKLEKIYYQYKSLMLNAAMRMTGHTYYAEEAVSDALLSITSTISQIDVSCEFRLRAYIYTVVKSSCMNVMKKKNMHIITVDIDEVQPASNDDLAAELEEREEYNTLLSKISKLPEKYKTVLIFKYVNELKTNDIAKILGVSIHTVNTRLKRGKQKLLEILGEEDGSNE